MKSYKNEIFEKYGREDFMANISRLRQNHLFLTAVKALDHARPSVSNFKVGAAAIARNPEGKERIISASNSELKAERHFYPFLRELSGYSIHAEGGLVAGLLSGEYFEHIIVVGENREPISPCGNCREILIASSNEEADILIKKSADSKPEWLLAADLLPVPLFLHKYSIADLQETDPLKRLFFDALYKMSDKPYNPYTSTAAAAALLTRKGNSYKATSKEDAAYYHMHSLEITLGIADSERDRELAHALFLSDHPDYEGPIFPCGRCLQKLYEAEQISDSPINIALARPKGDIWITTVNDLLPYAFGPKDLGIDLNLYK